MQFLSRWEQRTISYTIQKPTLPLGNCNMKIFHTQHHIDKSTIMGQTQQQGEKEYVTE